MEQTRDARALPWDQSGAAVFCCKQAGSSLSC
jgi:hypothetical protein